MNPLRKQSFLANVWRVINTVLIQLLVSEVFVLACGILLRIFIPEQWEDVYLASALFLNNVANVLLLLILVPKLKKDMGLRTEFRIIDQKSAVPFRWLDGFFLLFIGAALSMIVNLALTFFADFIKLEQHLDQMELLTDGKSVLVLILYMGIVAPITEEVIFRGLLFLRLRDLMSARKAAILSAVIFGLCHGNLAQFVYAGILGYVMAMSVEWTGSLLAGICLHVGANIWSTIISTYGVRIANSISSLEVLMYLTLLFLILVTGVSFYRKLGEGRKRRI